MPTCNISEFSFVLSSPFSPWFVLTLLQITPCVYFVPWLQVNLITYPRLLVIALTHSLSFSLIRRLSTAYNISVAARWGDLKTKVDQLLPVADFEVPGSAAASTATKGAAAPGRFQGHDVLGSPISGRGPPGTARKPLTKMAPFSARTASLY